jgi:hypothetical protein
MSTKFWFSKLDGRRPLENLYVDGSIILKWILGKEGWEEVCSMGLVKM